MELIRGLHNLRARHRGSVATAGNFDGVHIGHQEVLRRLRRRAARLALPSVVIVFEPTPQEFFAGDAAPARLSQFREKYLALAECEIDRMVCLRFDAALARMPPEEFIERLFVEGLGVRYLVVGDDFRFGRERRGDIAMLREAGERAGFEVAGTPSHLLDGQRVSSTGVRKALGAGELSLARSMLGRHYRMSGRVIEGNRLGRSLGYPTANLRLNRRVSPLHGIFAVRVDVLSHRSLPAVASLGTRPTVDGTHLLLEAHIFDFDKNLYGRHMDVDFVARLRDEVRFPSLDALTEQMHRDAAQARAILGC